VQQTAPGVATRAAIGGHHHLPVGPLPEQQLHLHRGRPQPGVFASREIREHQRAPPVVGAGDHEERRRGHGGTRRLARGRDEQVDVAPAQHEDGDRSGHGRRLVAGWLGKGRRRGGIGHPGGGRENVSLRSTGCPAGLPASRRPRHRAPGLRGGRGRCSRRAGPRAGPLSGRRGRGPASRARADWPPRGTSAHWVTISAVAAAKASVSACVSCGPALECAQPGLVVPNRRHPALR